MTVLSAIQTASLSIGIARPETIFSNPSRQLFELQAVANEAAAMIAQQFDWQALKRVHTITGDGTEDYPLPDDYGRMMKTAKLWSSRFLWDMEHIVDVDDWLSMEVEPVGQVFGVWTIFGNQMHIRPAHLPSETVKFFYISKEIVAGNNVEFTTDEDSFALDERLLTLAIIYLWKQKKGQDFAAELADFEMAFDRLTDSDGGSKPVLSGNTKRNWRCGNVWPGTVGG